MSIKLKFGVDRVKVNGPLVNGEYSVTFYTGEYEQLSMAKLMTIPQKTQLGVTVEYEGKKLNVPEPIDD